VITGPPSAVPRYLSVLLRSGTPAALSDFDLRSVLPNKTIILALGQPSEKRWKSVGGRSTRSYRSTIDRGDPTHLATFAMADRIHSEQDRTRDDDEYFRTRRYEGVGGS
jgi:hypothetical protein